VDRSDESYIEALTNQISNILFKVSYNMSSGVVGSPLSFVLPVGKKRKPLVNPFVCSS